MTVTPGVKRLPREQRRKQLIEAASGVFVQLGFHPASMDHIAEAAGVTKPVLYQHFSSKEDLYLAVMSKQSRELVGFISEAMNSTENNELRVARAVGAYFDFVDQPGNTFRLISDSDPVSDAVMRKLRSVELECAGLIANVIARNANLPYDLAELLAVGLTGLARSTATYWTTHKDTLDREEAAMAIKHLAYRGIYHFPVAAGSNDIEAEGLVSVIAPSEATAADPHSGARATTTMD